MKLWIRTVILIFFSALQLHASEEDILTEKYIRPTHVDPFTWSIVEPFLLPENNPIRPVLDEIFSASRVIYDRQSMLDAGFTPTPIQGNRAIVMTHPRLPGYVIKTYLDSVPHTRYDWESWVKRITGSELIRHAIKHNRWESYFKVAHKWIYPLPESPEPPAGSIRHNFILVVEDMDLAPYEQTRTRWFELQDKNLLKALYRMLHDLGLRDCARPRNIPWSNDGRVVFVDTESYYGDHVPYSQFNKRLNPEMLKYWIKITGQ